jgi:hypothetical protein
MKKLKNILTTMLIFSLVLAACTTNQTQSKNEELPNNGTVALPNSASETETPDKGDYTTGSTVDLNFNLGCNPTDVKFSPDGSQIAVSCFDKTFRIYELTDKEYALKSSRDLKWYIHSINWSPDGSMVALISRKALQLIDLDKNEIINSLELSKASETRIAWSPDSKYIAATVPGGSVLTETDSLAKIYSIPELKLIKEVNVDGVQPYGTNQLIWDGNVESPVMTIATMGGMIHVRSHHGTSLGFYGIQWNAAHIGIYSLGEDRYLTVTNEFGSKDAYSRTRLVVFDSLYMLFDYTIQNNLNGEELDPIVDSCFVLEEMRLYVLFQSGKLQVFDIRSNEIKLIAEEQVPRVGLIGKVEASSCYGKLIITRRDEPALFIAKP